LEIVIRKALPEDAHEYASCHISSWRSAYKGIVPEEYLNNLSVETRAERLRQNLREAKEVLFNCVTYENKIIGILVISKSRDEDKPNAGEIGAIYLIEEFWGKGYGRQMMNYATDTLKHMGYNEIILWVLEENIRARRFYEKCGFGFDGTKKEITIGKPLIEIRYALNL
jgi:RimJ/RimL family protein N-acetyltransferase